MNKLYNATNNNKSNTIPALSSITCLPSCEGIAKRVLKDLQKYELEDLKFAYLNDREHGGNNYKSIIELGEFLKALL